MKSFNRKSGFALLTVMFIIAALGVSVGILARIGQQRIFDAKRQTNRVKALAYAEAGIDFAYAILSTDFDTRNNPSAFSLGTDGDSEEGVALSSTGSAVKNSYGDGSFALSLTTVSNRYVIVNSVGHCNGVDVTTEVLVEDIYAGSGGSDAPDYSDMEAFNYAVLSGGEFDFGGCGYVGTAAKMQSNNELNIKGSAKTEMDISSPKSISIGNNLTITGSVTTPAPDWRANKVNITGGSTIATVPPVEIPDIDLTPYYNWALKNGEVYSSGATLPSNPKGGVIWVNGDVQLSQGNINGSIIATGNIHISGGSGVKITATADSVFALASRDGDITISTSGELTGLVYVKTGNYSQTANGKLIGQLIVNGDIKKGGNSDIIDFRQSIPIPPGVGSVTPTKSLPLIAGWQK